MSFAAYGALRKQALSDSVTGLFLETVMMAPVALAYLSLAGPAGGGFTSESIATDLLLIGAGIVTASPLLLFVAAAKRLHFSTIGVLFYLAPTIQFLLGVFVYREPLNFIDLVAFVCIWVALGLFAYRSYVDSRVNQPH